MRPDAAFASPRGEIVSPDEILILQELMNIAFGKAAADLAEVIDLGVLLKVPAVGVIPAAELPRQLCSESRDHPRVSVVAQEFWGDFQGSAFLVLPSSESKDLISLLGDGPPALRDEARYEPTDELERGTLMEVGNIIMSACVGKLAELLATVVRYTPPSATVDVPPDEAVPPDLFEHGHAAVVLQTRLSFLDHGLEGLVSVVTSGASIRWLRSALERFMQRYAA
jgi:chemotaxis protein CheC